MTVERVLSDNGSAYRPHAWHDVCAERTLSHKRTKPNGHKVKARSDGSTSPWQMTGPATPATSVTATHSRPTGDSA